ncbi:MAG: VIT family protein [Bacteroidetes bacterium]|nr:VIT family protein [Bacteroidota bacterium]
MHEEPHRTHRIGWLRAAVLGANDGIVSVASLLIGLAAAASDRATLLLGGIAGLVAGAMSMAAGEYVSVSSQADVERADLEIERRALDTAPDYELQELADIYVNRGLDADLAMQVAKQLTEHDALGAHVRDELGLSDALAARPFQAALSSAAAFTAGSMLPVLAAWLAPEGIAVVVIATASLFFLACLGIVSARAGGAPPVRAAVRVVFWGALAMAITAGVGAIVGTAV